jgi:hypothetical protein
MRSGGAASTLLPFYASTVFGAASTPQNHRATVRQGEIAFAVGGPRSAVVRTIERKEKTVKE